MTGFIRYQFISYIRSLKIIPPLTVFGAWVFILYAYKEVPILSSYAVTSIVIYLVMTWVAMSVFSIEEESEKHILFVQLGSKNRFLWGKWFICLMVALLLEALAISYPVLMNNFKGVIKPFHYGLAIYSHSFLALFGILVGTFFSVTSYASKKYAWLSAVFVIVVSLAYEALVSKLVLLKWVLMIFPPAVNVIRYLSNGDIVDIKMDFWLYASWSIVYILIGVIVIIKMFLMKES